MFVLYYCLKNLFDIPLFNGKSENPLETFDRVGIMCLLYGYFSHFMSF